jgi:hypothetical protein
MCPDPGSRCPLLSCAPRIFHRDDLVALIDLAQLGGRGVLGIDRRCAPQISDRNDLAAPTNLPQLGWRGVLESIVAPLARACSLNRAVGQFKMNVFRRRVYPTGESVARSGREVDGVFVVESAEDGLGANSLRRNGA